MAFCFSAYGLFLADLTRGCKSFCSSFVQSTSRVFWSECSFFLFFSSHSKMKSLMPSVSEKNHQETHGQEKFDAKCDTEEDPDDSQLKRILGVIFAMSSCIFFAISSLLVKLLHEIPPQEVVFFRSLVQVIFLLPPLIYSDVPVTGNTRNLTLLCIRGVAGTLALCCQFYAFQRMPLADATVIVFSSPVFTGVLAHFLLEEKWSWFDALATLLCFSGVVLIARPTFLFLRRTGVVANERNWEQVKGF